MSILKVLLRSIRFCSHGDSCFKGLDATVSFRHSNLETKIFKNKELREEHFTLSKSHEIFFKTK